MFGLLFFSLSVLFLFYRIPLLSPLSAFAPFSVPSPFRFLLFSSPLLFCSVPIYPLHFSLVSNLKTAQYCLSLLLCCDKQIIRPFVPYHCSGKTIINHMVAMSLSHRVPALVEEKLIHKE